ncbi:MAG: hypothetical protein WCK02_07265 [Bacteroidota bacterium]
MKFTFLITFTLLCLCSSAQSFVVFTASQNSGSVFYKVNADDGNSLVNLSEKLNLIAPLAGNDYGPICVSTNGLYYTFLSERFDADCQGWACLCYVDSNFQQVQVYKDANGQPIHSEGKSQMLPNGNAVIFSKDNSGEPNMHARDIFILRKTAGVWGNVENLSAQSTYEYNTYPAISLDGSKIVFDASTQSFPSEAAMTVNTDGTGLSVVITKDNIPSGYSAGPSVHSPSIAPNGSIVFEAEWGAGERLWRLPNGSNTPVLINATMGNDNSPTVLPDGRIASLQLPNATHDIKIMNADGSNASFVTGTASPFDEVMDIGISSYSSTSTSIEKSIAKISAFEYNSIQKSIMFSANGTMKICDLTGRLLCSNSVFAGSTYSTSEYLSPILVVFEERGYLYSKVCY